MDCNVDGKKKDVKIKEKPKKNDKSQKSEKKERYAPDESLPNKPGGEPAPDPNAQGAHTRLGTKNGSKGPYKYAREFDKHGNPQKEFHFTNHGRPSNHPSEHFHQRTPNPSGGTYRWGKTPEPLEIPPPK